MSKADENRQTKRYYRKMTVAHIREHSKADSLEVIFLESARFYRLLRKNPAYGDILKRLRVAMTEEHVLNVGFASPESDIIEDVV